LQKLLADRLGLEPIPQTPAQVAAALHDRRVPPSECGAMVLLIDGAERLPPAVLHYLWLMHRMTNLVTARLQIVLVGQPTLWERFTGPELNQLQAEIAECCVLQRLPDGEALDYLRYRLLAAGARAPVTISRQLAATIVTLGLGLPSRLNLIALSLFEHKPSTPRVTLKATHVVATNLVGVTFAHLPASLGGSRRQNLRSGVIAATMLGLWALSLASMGAAPFKTAAMSPGSALEHKSTPPGTVLAKSGMAIAKAVAARSTVLATLAPAILAPPTSAPVPLPNIEPHLAVQPARAFADAVALQNPSRTSATSMAMAPVPHEAATKLTAASGAQPTMTLSDAATLKINLWYWPASRVAAAGAARVAASLRSRGYVTADPVAAPGTPHSTAVEYDFLQDQKRAEQLARDLGCVAVKGRLGGSHEPAALPPPGTLQLILTNYAPSAAR